MYTRYGHSRADRGQKTDEGHRPERKQGQFCLFLLLSACLPPDGRWSIGFGSIATCIQSKANMGKPTWVEGGGRRGDPMNLDSPEPAEPHFPRRFPRLGAAFQCKGIPDLVPSREKYATTRAPPEKMSTEVPYRTVAEASSKDGSCGAIRAEGDDAVGGRVPGTSSSDTGPTAGGKGKATLEVFTLLTV